MKYFYLFLITVTTLVSALAQPINYQGRLKEKSGTNVNGTKNFTLRIFDAKTGGKQIYEENVGAVTVNEGAYSFNFGESGKSVVASTETMGMPDGDKQVFNYTVKNKPIADGIKISWGGYSWTESGSSDASKFIATANKNSGAVSAIFLTTAPPFGVDRFGQGILIQYNYIQDGIMGALSRGGQAWLEITVGGETLSPRERLVSVPFALKSEVANSVLNLPESVVYSEKPKGYANLFGSVVMKTLFYYLPDTGARSVKVSTKYALHGEGLFWLKVKSLDNSFTKEVVKPAHNQRSSSTEDYKSDSIELEPLPKSGFIVIEYGFRLKNPGDRLGMNIGPHALTIKY